MSLDWNLYPNFTEDEFRCKCGCGRADMDRRFMHELQRLRKRYARPMIITSGFRCPEYNARISSTGLTGPHTTGKACDIGVSRGNAFELIVLAMDIDRFTGLGVNQKGNGRFIHLDSLDSAVAPRPTVWSY